MEGGLRWDRINRGRVNFKNVRKKLCSFGDAN